MFQEDGEVRVLHSNCAIQTAIDSADGGWTDLSGAVLHAELIGRLVEVTRKALDSADVTAYGGLREVMSLEFLQHNFA